MNRVDTRHYAEVRSWWYREVRRTSDKVAKNHSIKDAANIVEHATRDGWSVEEIQAWVDNLANKLAEETAHTLEHRADRIRFLFEVGKYAKVAP